MTEQDDREDYPEIVEHVSVEVIKLHSSSHHRKGTNDYSSETRKIVAIVDREGTRHDGTWKQDWATLSAGIATRQTAQGQQLNIKRSACPVRVLYHAFSEYVSYDCQNHCQQSSKDYWIMYLSDEGDTK